MYNAYEIEKVAQLKLDESARRARAYRHDETTPRRKRRLRLPRLTWQRPVIRPA